MRVVKIRKMLLMNYVSGLTTDIKNLDSAINTFTSDSGDLSQSID